MDRAAGGFLGGAPGAPHRLARGRAARRRPVPDPRPGRDPVGRRARAWTRSCRRRPRSSARSPVRSTRPGCPTCSWGSTRCPCRRSTRRRTPRPQRIAAAAVDGTARITTRACNSQVNGTGVVIAPGYVVTNAHVVAGATAIRVDDRLATSPTPSRCCSTRARRRRPACARASTAAPSGSRPPSPNAAATGAALGLRGWRLAGRPAGRGRGLVRGDRPRHLRPAQVRREIIELRAAIEPGDSGGPLILDDGTIGGLVFAESRDRPGRRLRAQPGRGLDPRRRRRSAGRARRRGPRASIEAADGRVPRATSVPGRTSGRRCRLARHLPEVPSGSRSIRSADGPYGGPDRPRRDRRARRARRRVLGDVPRDAPAVRHGHRRPAVRRPPARPDARGLGGDARDVRRPPRPGQRARSPDARRARTRSAC